MGLFKKLDQKGQLVYGIDYYANGRRYRNLVGPKKALAEAALAKVKTEIAENKFLDKKKDEKIRFDEFAELYLDLHCKVNHAGMKYARSQAEYLKGYFKGKYLHEIDAVAAEQLKRQRMKEVKPATVNRSLAMLRTMFNKAIAWKKYHGENPLKGIKMLNEGPGRLRYLEKEEIKILISNCERHLRPIVILAINTGMRCGEILNLKWQDIDFQRGIIHLYKTKNKEKREVYMNEQVKNVLIDVRKNPRSSYVFVHSNGEKIKDIRKPWFKALRLSGITNFKFHDLRHSFASHLVMSGIDINTVRELLGHKSMAMTIRYSHLSQSHKQRAVDILLQRLDINRSYEKKQEQLTADQIISMSSIV